MLSRTLPVTLNALPQERNLRPLKQKRLRSASVAAHGVPNLSRMVQNETTLKSRFTPAEQKENYATITDLASLRGLSPSAFLAGKGEAPAAL